MKKWLVRSLVVLVPLLLIAAWIVYFHNALLTDRLAKDGWLQTMVARLGEKTGDTAAADDEDPDNTKNAIPVHTAQVTVATLHRYIDGIGMVAARPQRQGQMAGSASIVSPVAGIVAKVNCQVGQQAHAGDALIQLDNRLAKAAADQADAALAQAQASLAALKATPRPDQLQIAELAVEKSQSAVEFTQKNYDRQKQLASDQSVSGKSLEQAGEDLLDAKNDLAVNQRQLALLKASPTPEDLNQEQAKVAQAVAAAAAARMQLEMLTIAAPIDATVVEVSVNPGDSVDTTKTLVQLIALDRLMIDLDVPADQLPPNAVGMTAQILPTAAVWKSEGGGTITGTVAFVSPQVEPRNGSVMVGIDLPPDAGLRPGLTVKVRIIAEEHKDCLAVPREAVVADENGDNVIAVVQGEQATHKSVKIGLEENGLIEIKAEGIQAGTTVVTAGAYGLPAATHVKVVN